MEKRRNHLALFQISSLLNIYHNDLIKIVLEIISANLCYSVTKKWTILEVMKTEKEPFLTATRCNYNIKES